MELNDALECINESVRGLNAYHLTPRDTPIKLNQNENPFDWPREIKEEMAVFCRERPWNRYPHFIPVRLKEALAGYAGVSPDAILAGNGSNEILLVLFLSLLGNGTPLIICEPTFTVHSLVPRGIGTQPKAIMLKKDLTHDVDSLYETLRRFPSALLLLSSPNNPTGTSLTEHQIRRLLAEHRGFCILDQAYAEFGGYDAVPLCAEYPNLIITRTFSKAFAGAGLRLGYLIGTPGVVAEITKIKLPYNINFFSEHAAELLLARHKIMADRIAELIESRDRLYEFLRTLPLENVYKSDANFILIRASEKNALFDHLCDRGILIRDVSAYPMLENCLRISIGTRRENALVTSALKDFFG